MTLTVSTNNYDDLSARYTKHLAEALQASKNKLSRELFKRALRRSKDHNSYTHGALNAIHKDTKTV
jgi:hypothetical protein